MIRNSVFCSHIREPGHHLYLLLMWFAGNILNCARSIVSSMQIIKLGGFRQRLNHRLTVLAHKSADTRISSYES